MGTENELNIDDVRKIDLVSYLAAIGLEPVKIRGNDYWYLSPFREEQTPSFKINRNKNFWIDFGQPNDKGKFAGGTIIDFALQFYDLTIAEFLDSLKSEEKNRLIRRRNLSEQTLEDTSRLFIIRTTEIESPALLNYLKQRRISVEVASLYCQEVHYHIDGKKYFGIGFKNISGGYEIRNPYAKVSSNPKDISIIKNKSEKVVVFEGFMDFLSFLSVNLELRFSTFDYVILNTVTFFEKAREFMESHQQILLYLDRDATGLAITSRALSLNRNYEDGSLLYERHKDFNDWIMNFGRSGHTKRPKFKNPH